MKCSSTHLPLLLLSLIAADPASASTLVKLKSRQDSAADSSSAPDRIPDSSSAPDRIPDSSSAPDRIPDSSSAPDRIPDSSSAPDRIPDSSSAPDWIPVDSNTEISDTGDWNTDDAYTGSETTTEDWYTVADHAAQGSPSCAYPQESLGSTSGVISVGSTNNTYLNNQDCEWWLQAPPGTVFYIAWLFLDLEVDYQCSWDYVQVHDVSTDGQILSTRKYCGARLPEGSSSSSSRVLVRFHSDGSVVRSGFTLSYTSAPLINVTWSANSTPSLAPDRITGTSGLPFYPNHEESCGSRQELDGLSGNISVGSTSSNYQNNQRCEWLLQAPPGTDLRVTWLSFDLEAHPQCQFDYVEIQETASDTDDVNNCCENIVRRYCGARLPVGFSTSNPWVTVSFHSDTSVVRPGFTLSYTFTTVNGTRNNTP